MSRGDIKIERVKSANRANFALIKDVLTPEVLHERVPRIAEAQEARVRYRNLLRQMNLFRDFAPGTNFKYVAQIDQSVWQMILDVFAKIEPTTGELMDDGLLYTTDTRGNIVLNRPFFFALLDMLQGAGYQCDMRAKVKLT